MRLRNLILVSLLATTGTLVPGVAAQASSGQCHKGEICVWEDAGFGRGFAYWGATTVPNYAGLKFDNGDPMNDHVSSLWNRTTHTVYFYPNSNYSGGYDLSVPSGVSHSNLSADGTRDGLKYNDAFSSQLVGS